ncbi:MAG: hypothetical protein CMB70_04230 [Euryarchaeota archaeon]|nr:hypothetical protein [Euryarchaeota archaeon]
MCDEPGVLTLDKLLGGTIILKPMKKQNDCLSCTNSCQKKQTAEIIEVAEVKVKSKCCKRYERKKKAPCKGCPERPRAVA